MILVKNLDLIVHMIWMPKANQDAQIIQWLDNYNVCVNVDPPLGFTISAPPNIGFVCISKLAFWQ